MKDERKVSFLEKIACSVLTGAASGAVCGVAKCPDELRDNFTKAMIDLTLQGQEKWKDRDRKGYFNV